jgi:hypothetical protein
MATTVVTTYASYECKDLVIYVLFSLGSIIFCTNMIYIILFFSWNIYVHIWLKLIINIGLMCVLTQYIIHFTISKRMFEATDAKMLRVSISTTYDMINVALKCFQEFGQWYMLWVRMNEESGMMRCQCSIVDHCLCDGMHLLVLAMMEEKCAI